MGGGVQDLLPLGTSWCSGDLIAGPGGSRFGPPWALVSMRPAGAYALQQDGSGASGVNYRVVVGTVLQKVDLLGEGLEVSSKACEDGGLAATWRCRACPIFDLLPICRFKTGI
jgi:hypothetical protein